MARDTILFETNGPKFSGRLGGLMWLVIGGGEVYLVSTMHWLPSDSPGGFAFRWLAWGWIASFGLFFVRAGLGMLFGEAGVYLESPGDPFVFWKRNWVFMHSAVRCSPHEFDAIRVQKWKKRGAKVMHHGYAVTLSGKDRTRLVEFFERKEEAAEMAKRLAACCHLAIQADEAEGMASRLPVN